MATALAAALRGDVVPCANDSVTVPDTSGPVTTTSTWTERGDRSQHGSIGGHASRGGDAEASRGDGNSSAKVNLEANAVVLGGHRICVFRDCSDDQACHAITNKARVAGAGEGASDITTHRVGIAVVQTFGTFVNVVTCVVVGIQTEPRVTATCVTADTVGASLTAPSVICRTLIDIVASVAVTIQ